MDTYHPWKGRIATSSSHQAPGIVARYRGYIGKNGIIGRYPDRYSLEQENTAGSTMSGMERCLSRNGVTRNSKADPERSPVNRSSSYAIPFARFQQGSAPKSLLRSIRSCAPFNIHETISIVADLHRAPPILSRSTDTERLVVNKKFFFFFFSFSFPFNLLLSRIPSIRDEAPTKLSSSGRETLFANVQSSTRPLGSPKWNESFEGEV